MDFTEPEIFSEKGKFMKRVYLAGPMRGIPEWNFPAFDRAEIIWRRAGWEVMSPAGIDRAMGIKIGGQDDPQLTRRAMAFDITCLYYADAIAMLPGWQESSGATVELALAQFLGLTVYDAVTMEPLLVTDKPWGAIVRLFNVAKQHLENENGTEMPECEQRLCSDGSTVPAMRP